MLVQDSVKIPGGLDGINFFGIVIVTVDKERKRPHHARERFSFWQRFYPPAPEERGNISGLHIAA